MLKQWKDHMDARYDIIESLTNQIFHLRQTKIVKGNKYRGRKSGFPAKN